MADKVYQSFLATQTDEALALAGDSDILTVRPVGKPPQQHFVAEYAARGLVKDRAGQVVEAVGFAVGIWLPEDYLRHVIEAQVLSYLGPHPQPWHPNIRPPYMCVHLVAGTPLVDVLYTCYELWTWSLYYTGDEGLNHAATQWARQQDPERFPIDRRPLKRRRLDIEVAPATRGAGR